MIFEAKNELHMYLNSVNPIYAKYTEGLWASGVNSISQLADASLTVLQACGIENPVHAGNIIAQSEAPGVGRGRDRDYAGRVVEALEEGPGPSKKSKTGHSSQILLVDQSHVLIKQLLYDPLPDPALPTSSSQVSEWLFGFTQLKVPVTALFYQHTSTIAQQQLAPQDDAASAVVTLTELLQAAPRLPYSTEMHTSVYVCNFVGSVWGCLTTHSPTNLKYSLLLNKASQLHNVSSHAIAPKSRPDTMLAAESCTLLLGEDKHIDLMAAYRDFNRKRVDLSGMHTMVHSNSC